MEVILKENYVSLGYVGDKVQVANGFARNFLIPRGIAVEATGRNMKVVEHMLQGIQSKRRKLRTEAESIKQELEKLSLEFTLRASGGGRAFGSISSRDIEAALKERNFDIDRRQIRLAEAIRKAGDYVVNVKLHAEVSASIPLKANLEIVAPPAKEEGKAAKSRRGKPAEDEAAGTEEPAAEAETTAEEA